MKRFFKRGVVFSFLVFLGLFIGCQNQGVNPDESIYFQLNVRHVVDTESHSSNQLNLNKNEAIDNVRVMVVDISDFDSLTFSDNTDYQTFVNNNDLGYALDLDWSDWQDRKHFIEEHFNLVSDNELIVGPAFATGYVQGVVGLNWIIIAYEEEGVITNHGETTVLGVKGEANTANMEVYEYYSNY